MNKALIFTSLLLSVSIIIGALIIASALQGLKAEVCSASTRPISVRVFSDSAEGFHIAPVKVQVDGSLGVLADVRPCGDAFPVRQITGPSKR
jgi:hypothetical protein